MFIFTTYIFNTYIVAGTVLGVVKQSDAIPLLEEFTALVEKTLETESRGVWQMLCQKQGKAPGSGSKSLSRGHLNEVQSSVAWGEDGDLAGELQLVQYGQRRQLRVGWWQFLGHIRKFRLYLRVESIRWLLKGCLFLVTFLQQSDILRIALQCWLWLWRTVWRKAIGKKTS